ncbi:tRNA (N(6)-L-threonylcarbamoyladenosine(37)-C(2))-methylthiotransferase MtaB [Arboricoccus pini]
MSSEPTLEVITFGCRLNSYESEVIRAHASAASIDNAIIIHTCAVTAEAERQARQAIRKARRERPGARLIVTGCSAQVASRAYADMPEVDHVVGNAEKLDPDVWKLLAQPSAKPKVQVGDIMLARETAGHLVEGFDGRTRAFLEVQGGCDHRCTFCIIPFGRGPSRSIAASRVIEQARLLVAAGYRELVVTGVDITSWGKDLEGTPTLGSLLRDLLDSVPDLPRLRLSSLDPAEIDPDLQRLIRDEPRLMPHLHLSVQAGDDLTLKRMKRRHSRRDVIEVAQHLRSLRSDIVYGADLIAGFPTETETMFENTLQLVDEAGLTYLHVFPYSPRAGTPAARMPQVDRNIRKERAKRLREAGDAALGRFLASQIGRRQSVLVEQGGMGRTAHFATMRLPPGGPAVSSIAEIVATDIEDGLLVGSMAEAA